MAHWGNIPPEQMAEESRKKTEQAGLRDFMLKQRQRVHVMYLAEGFDVDTGGSLKTLPYIDVKMVPATIDPDFYDRGDDHNP